jgi:hypothetical protein
MNRAFQKLKQLYKKEMKLKFLSKKKYFIFFIFSMIFLKFDLINSLTYFYLANSIKF